MIKIDGLPWFVGALVLCGALVLYLRSWRRWQRQSQAWWLARDAEALRRHAEFLRAFAREDEAPEDAVVEVPGTRSTPGPGLDPEVQKILGDFDALAKKRAAELLPRSGNSTLQAIGDRSFCLGYKAGVFDFNQVLRSNPEAFDWMRFHPGTSIEEAVFDVTQLAEVFAAACAWRHALQQPGVGHLDVEDQLIAAIDAAGAARKVGTP